MPKAPSNYDPFKYPDRAVARRNWVIDRVVENGFATKDEGEAAKAQPLGVIKRQTGPKIFASEYFAEEVRREILDRFGEDKLYGGGLSVRTTLDPRLQRLARTALVNGFVAYDHRHAGWRGPVKQIDIKGDWGKTLGSHADVVRHRSVAACRRARSLQGPGHDRTASGRTVDRRPGEGARNRGHSLRRSEVGAAEGRRTVRRNAGHR